MAMARKKISTTIYITPEQNEQLKLLNSKTRVPVAEYIRQGIDLVLDKERHNLPGTAAAGGHDPPLITTPHCPRGRSRSPPDVHAHAHQPHP